MKWFFENRLRIKQLNDEHQKNTVLTLSQELYQIKVSVPHRGYRPPRSTGQAIREVIAWLVSF